VPTVREPFTGAWQRNLEQTGESILRNPTIYSCATLIAETIGKCQLRLVQQTDPDVWTPTTNPAYSPVLRKPNRYQTIQKFLECWLASKLLTGNTYILKQRDGRGVVVALYVLDPARVTVLVAPDGAVYYQIQRNDLAGMTPDASLTPLSDGIVVPAREVIHDLMVPLFHPLVGVSPIYACAVAALSGLAMQDNSAAFFANGSQPSGVLLVAGGTVVRETRRRECRQDRRVARRDHVSAGGGVGRRLTASGATEMVDEHDRRLFQGAGDLRRFQPGRAVRPVGTAGPAVLQPVSTDTHDGR
jgi:HK97 family phage portal protein